MTQQTPYRYRGTQFFAITLLGTWFFEFIAAYLSFQPGQEQLAALLLLPSALLPCATALILIFRSKNTALIQDFWSQFSPRKLRLNYLLFIAFLFPAILFLATASSLLIGQPMQQFQLANEIATGTSSTILGFFVPVFMAPLLEELGWRGYGVDSIRSGRNLLQTSLLFWLLWAGWHLPLFFIKGFYNHQLWEQSFIYVLNYFVSLLPAAILINWVYYKNSRSIISAIFFHSMVNLSAVTFQTTQPTKCIVTLLFLVVASIVIYKDREFFFLSDLTNSR